MEARPITDAATLLDQGVDDHRAFVLYDVYGWTVKLSADVYLPWDGPEDLTVVADTNTNEGIELAWSTDGVTSEVLRAIPLAHARKALRRLRLAARRETGEVVIKHRLESYRDWVEFAKVYADAAAEGRRQPLQYLAELTGLSRNTLSARVRRAREMGLLTRPSKGNLGALTDEAKRALVAGSLETELVTEPPLGDPPAEGSKEN